VADVVDVVTDADSHPDSSSVDEGEYDIGSEGETLGEGNFKEIGWHGGTGVDDNVWIGVGDLECERVSLSVEEASGSEAQYAGEIGGSFVGRLGKEAGGMRSSGERDGDGEGGYARDCDRGMAKVEQIVRARRKGEKLE